MRSWFLCRYSLGLKVYMLSLEEIGRGAWKGHRPASPRLAQAYRRATIFAHTRLAVYASPSLVPT
jgi:hypothetical protein